MSRQLGDFHCILLAAMIVCAHSKWFTLAGIWIKLHPGLDLYLKRFQLKNILNLYIYRNLFFSQLVLVIAEFCLTLILVFHIYREAWPQVWYRNKTIHLGECYEIFFNQIVFFDFSFCN